MSPRLRVMLIAALGVGLGLALAFEIAGETYFLGPLLAAAILWLVANWSRGALPDAWLLGFVLFGYIVGNRGFAQLSFSTRLPLLPAETALLVCGGALLVRMAFRQTAALVRDGLNVAILLWILAGAARLPLDVREFGIMALRDFAMIYYAAFFFIAQAIGGHEKTRALLRRALTAAFVVLPVVTVANQLAPEFFLSTLTWRGTPLVFQKFDLAAAFLAGGVFWFWARRENGGSRLWLLPAAACLLMEVSVVSPRAAMVGTALTTIAWVMAGRRKLLEFEAGVFALALAIALPIFALAGRNFTQTKPYVAYERVISLVDWGETRIYKNRESSDAVGNNRFRRIWWRAVALETVEQNPAFGLGFGYDLADRFRADYDWLANEDFSARSPHSILLSAFGRMGAVGLGLLLLIAALMAARTWPAFQRRDFEAMGLWSVVWVLAISACFGVVLEGPMGAVVFWTVLGLAVTSPRAQAAVRDGEAAGGSVEKEIPGVTAMPLQPGEPSSP